VTHVKQIASAKWLYGYSCLGPHLDWQLSCYPQEYLDSLGRMNTMKQSHESGSGLSAGSSMRQRMEPLQQLPTLTSETLESAKRAAGPLSLVLTFGAAPNLTRSAEVYRAMAVGRRFLRRGLP